MIWVDPRRARRHLLECLDAPCMQCQHAARALEREKSKAAWWTFQWCALSLIHSPSAHPPARILWHLERCRARLGPVIEEVQA